MKAVVIFGVFDVFICLFVSCNAERNDDRERQRRYRERIRSDPERLQAYLEKDRCRYRYKFC